MRAAPHSIPWNRGIKFRPLAASGPDPRGGYFFALLFGSMAAHLDVRVYRPDDEEAVVILWNDVFKKPEPRNEPRFLIAKKLAIQADLFFVAEEDRAIVGTAMGGYDGHRGWLYTVAVRSDARRRGIGSALVRSQCRRRRFLRALGLRGRRTCEHGQEPRSLVIRRSSPAHVALLDHSSGEQPRSRKIAGNRKKE